MQEVILSVQTVLLAALVALIWRQRPVFGRVASSVDGTAPDETQETVVIRKIDNQYIGIRPSHHPDVAEARRTKGLKICYTDGREDLGEQ